MPDVNRRRRIIHYGRRWFHSGTWINAGDTWTNNPTLGSQLFANNSFDTDTIWTKQTGWSISGGQAVAAAASSGVFQSLIMTTGQWYHQTIDIASVTSGSFSPYDGVSATPTARSSAGTGIWTFLSQGGTANVSGRGTTPTGTIDTTSIYQLTLNTLAVLRSAGQSNTVTANFTMSGATGAWSGVIAKADGLALSNCILGIHDGSGTVRMYKCVNGTWTQLITASVTYTAGAAIQVKPSGATNTWQLFYNGTQRGTDQTVSDASIINCSLYGGFSTYSGNSLASLALS